MVLWIILLIALAGVLCVAYGVVIERRWYRVRRYRLDILPAATETPLRVLHLSDLHLVRRDTKMPAFLATLERPDITVLTGDVVGEPEAVEHAVAALEPVRGRVASFLVLGSNDLFSPTPINYVRYFRKRHRVRVGVRGRSRELIEQLTRDGWTVLRNDRRQLDLGGLQAEVVGLEDAHIVRHDLRAALRDHPERFGIAILHSPDPTPELVALGYPLIFAGHTHGGQVRLPLIGALVTNGQLPRRLCRGVFRIGPSVVSISAGLGQSKYAPFRFFCPPEVSLIDLRPSHQEAEAPPIATSKMRS
ncbi:MAG: metallophosphoesterase [Actinomycetota bacterium]